MLTEAEYQQRLRERAAAERRARGDREPERGYDAALPSNLTPRQKLDIANANFQKRGDGFVEEPLNESELGMTLEAFNRLPAARRNEIHTRIMFERRCEITD